GIGITEHEPPSVKQANALPLEEGMAFSVEPGIYLPGEVGVRLEEIVVVTAQSAEVLSRLPREVKVTGGLFYGVRIVHAAVLPGDTAARNPVCRGLNRPPHAGV